MKIEKDIDLPQAEGQVSITPGRLTGVGHRGVRNETRKAQ